MTHICEEMNVTGCTEWHNQVNNLTGLKYFLHHYQVESAFIMVFLLIIAIIVGINIHKRIKFAKRGKKE